MIPPTTPADEVFDIGANATRADWEIVCPRKDQLGNEYEIYIAGNPPFEGSRKQKENQKSDIEYVFKNNTRLYKSLDYVSIWYFKMAQYISGYELIKGALVSTNSVTQGEQVSLLWPIIFKQNIEIFFGYKSFKWKNLAKGNAGVTCVIIGLSNPNTRNKRLYGEHQYINAKEINPYLTEGKAIFIHSRSKPLSVFPEMNFGNMPADGGKLLFTQEEKDEFIEKEQGSKKWFRKLISADEFLNGKSRYCLWLEGISDNDLNNLPLVRKRIEELRIIRLNSSRPQLANTPHLFAQITQPKDISYILIPRHSSENRDYIPMDIFSKNEIAHDSCLIAPAEDKYMFAVLTSRMHMVWMRAVGGKLETSYRYSKDLVYNTFPYPAITPKQKDSLASHVYNILEERENALL